MNIDKLNTMQHQRRYLHNSFFEFEKLGRVTVFTTYIGRI